MRARRSSCSSVASSLRSLRSFSRSPSTKRAHRVAENWIWRGWSGSRVPFWVTRRYQPRESVRKASGRRSRSAEAARVKEPIAAQERLGAGVLGLATRTPVRLVPLSLWRLGPRRRRRAGQGAESSSWIVKRSRLDPREGCCDLWAPSIRRAMRSLPRASEARSAWAKSPASAAIGSFASLGTPRCAPASSRSSRRWARGVHRRSCRR